MSEAPGRDPAEVMRNITALEAAEDRAFKRGQNAAQLNAQVQNHERRLDAINGSIDRHAMAQEATNRRLETLTAKVEQNMAIAADRAKAAKEAAERQVSTRTFLIGLVSTVAAVGLLLAATGHA